MREFLVSEERPEARVFPARIGHDPVEIVDQPVDEKVGIALARRQAAINRKSILPDQMRNNRVAVADHVPVIEEIGKLGAWGLARVENMLMVEGEAA